MFVVDMQLLVYSSENTKILDWYHWKKKNENLVPSLAFSMLDLHANMKEVTCWFRAEVQKAQTWQSAATCA